MNWELLRGFYIARWKVNIAQCPSVHLLLGRNKKWEGTTEEMRGNNRKKNPRKQLKKWEGTTENEKLGLKWWRSVLSFWRNGHQRSHFLFFFLAKLQPSCSQRQHSGKAGLVISWSRIDANYTDKSVWLSDCAWHKREYLPPLHSARTNNSESIGICPLFLLGRFVCRVFLGPLIRRARKKSAVNFARLRTCQSRSTWQKVNCRRFNRLANNTFTVVSA